MTKTPIFGANGDQKYIPTGQRQKGDPVDSDCFNEVKRLLAGVPDNGLNQRLIAEQTKTSVVTVRLISQCDTFAGYRAMRSGKSNWRAPKPQPKKRGLLARLLRR